MAKGVGVDIESVKRIGLACKSERFLKRWFSEAERRYCLAKSQPHLSLAGRFCAKEAVVKALAGKVTIEDVEILNCSSGEPEVRIKKKKRKDVKVSISHTEEYAVAFALAE
jgi:phosphopantetheine--protein transferase-like protein